MKKYQIQSRYYLDRSIYLRVLALMGDYKRMQAELEAIEHGQSYGGLRVSSDEDRAGAIRSDVERIRRATAVIPQEYVSGVLENLCEGTRMLDLPNASERTWKTWRARFIFELARLNHWI